jgi:predicted nucleotidyltransferase
MDQTFRTVSLPSQKYNELIPQSTIEGIIKSIETHFNPCKIFLFGSYANGSANPDSDLDLLLVMDSDLPKHKRAIPIKLLFKPMPCAMNIFVFNLKEYDYWNGTENHIITEVTRYGKLMYER